MTTDTSDNGAAMDIEPGKTEGDGAGKRSNPLSRAERHVQRSTLSGLFELVPLLATIGVVAFLIQYADALVRNLPFVSGQRWDFPGIGLIAMVMVFYLVGLVVSTTLGRKLMNGFSDIIGHIPVVKVVYNVMRQAMASIGSSKGNFSRVVFVEWPREGMVAMGFVTGRVYSQEKAASLVSVYIPTVPNPTSGNMAFVFEDDVIETNLNPDDAMKLVFSGGIVLPETISLARLPADNKEDRMTHLAGQFRTASTPKLGDDRLEAPSK